MLEDEEQLKIMELREGMKIASYTFASDQQQSLPQPPMQKSWGGEKIIPLTKVFDAILQKNNFLHLLNSRTSKRNYSDDALTLDELSFLLWATQGVKGVIGRERKATLRTVPSAGARHPFETYIFVNRVEKLEPGLYHYLALDHKLEFLSTIEDQQNRVSAAFAGQTFYGFAPVGFVWTVIPYRTEWRYTVNAQKYAMLDAGHVCQNLYLACEAIGCGACAIGAYDQGMVDELLGLDSSPSADMDNEFAIYAASVGKVE